jgi:dCMP deaminase
MKKEQDKDLFNLAFKVSQQSQDPNRKTGAVIVDENYVVKSTGYNSLPTNCDSQETLNKERYGKPLKYMWVEHSERNAIYNAVKNGISLNGCKMYVTYFPCCDCARAIIQSGIKEVYTPKPDWEHHKWGESWKISKQMFEEGNIKLKFI